MPWLRSSARPSSAPDARAHPKFVARPESGEDKFRSQIATPLVTTDTNELIGEPNILGVKTGTTAAAGPCVAVSVERDPLVRDKPDGEKAVTPRRLIVVVLNNPDRFNRARGFIRPGWTAYDRWVAAGAPVGNRNKEILDVPNPR